jgi:single-strand DNA-binding protein
MYNAKGTFNRVEIIGRLGRDPDLKYSQSGSAYCFINVATTAVFSKQNEERQEKTEWNSLTAFGKTAELIAQYLVKGSRAFFAGRVSTEPKTDANGIKSYRTTITISEVVFLDAKSENQGREPEPARTKPPVRYANPDEGFLDPEMAPPAPAPAGIPDATDDLPF